MFQPRHYAADIALELAKGLSDGTITLEQHTQPQEKTSVPKGFHRIIRRDLFGFVGLSSLLVALAAIIVKKLPNSSEARRLREWQFAREVKTHLNMVRRNGSGAASPSEIGRLEEKLARANRSSPEYWPTVFELVTIKTQGVVDLSRLKRPVFNVNLSGLPANLIFGEQVVILSGSGALEGCRFIDCLVSFDLKEPAFFYDVRFIRCSFFMPRAAATSRPVQRIATSLMAASDMGDLSVSISG